MAPRDVRSLSREEYAEMEAKLKSLNKPAKKTIYTEWGDIFDCVDIYEQPAFDHPLLKNHKIEMRPRSCPINIENAATSSTTIPIGQSKKAMIVGFKDGECPVGTVPIRRTRMEDLLRAETISSYGRKESSNGKHFSERLTQIAMVARSTSKNLDGSDCPANVDNASANQKSLPLSILDSDVSEQIDPPEESNVP